MADHKSRTISLVLTLALVALNLIAFNYLIAGWSTARMDLTQEGLYSISPATKRILRSLDEDVTIYGYFSNRTHPKLSPLVPTISDLLDEYRAVSRGRVHVEIVDPAEDEEAARDAADRYGVRSVPFRLASKYESGIVNAYFALVVKYGDKYERYGFDDLIQVEPMPDGDIDVRLRNLEYDLTRAMKKVVHGFHSAHELFERIEEPVRLTVIMTPDSLPEILSEVPEAVRTAAEELEEAGGDKFEYETMDPFNNEDDRAVVEGRFGFRPMTLGLLGEESFYLYGVLQVGDELEQLLLAGADVTAASIREAVENSLRRHTPGFLKTVGIYTPDSSDPMQDMRAQFGLPPSSSQPEFEQLKRYLDQDYQIADVDLHQPVPSEVDILLVLKPKSLSETQVYNLDQHLMRGGRIVLCAGKFEADFTSGLSVKAVHTGLDAWLKHFGLAVSDSLVLDDRNQALPVPEVRHTSLGSLRTWTMAPYPYLVQVREEGFVNQNITASLDAVGIYWGSPVVVDESPPEGLEIAAVLKSSDLSWTSDDLSLVGFVDYEVPAEGTESHTLAVAASGRFDSFFADRDAPSVAPPEQPEFPGSDVEETDDEAPAKPTTVPLKQSPETRLVLIGNAEFLNDFVANTIGGMDGGFFVENLRFTQNVIDWISLDNEMIGIRARGLVSRRLERIEKSAEITVEAISYLIPVVLLSLLGFYLQWKRRSAGTVPATEGTARVSPAQPSGKGA